MKTKIKIIGENGNISECCEVNLVKSDKIIIESVELEEPIVIGLNFNELNNLVSIGAKNVYIHDMNFDADKYKYHVFEWNYKIPIEAPDTLYRGDWNQTLITKFNQLYAMNRFNLLRLGDLVVVFVPIKFMKIIESLDYYNDRTNTLAGKYFISYHDYEDTTNTISFPLKHYKLTSELTPENSRYINILNFR